MTPASLQTVAIPRKRGLHYLHKNIALLKALREVHLQMSMFGGDDPYYP
jgi:hypothetical protein